MRALGEKRTSLQIVWSNWGGCEAALILQSVSADDNRVRLLWEQCVADCSVRFGNSTQCYADFEFHWFELFPSRLQLMVR
jgi:hypothetical protein